jgi:AcrR family transcriptional regulator
MTKAQRTRRTIEQTRQLLLDAAVDLLRERAESTGDDVVAAALAHVRFTQVAERATERVRASDPQAPPVTTGAIYNLWANQVDFQVDLLLHVADRQAVLTPGEAQVVARFGEAAAHAVPLAETVRSLIEEVHRNFTEDPIFRVELGFLIGASDQRVQRALARRQELFAVSADRVWQGLLDAYGLTLRPGHSVRGLTMAIAASVVGSVVLWHANPGSVADPVGEPGWSLTARAVQAILASFTLPSP